MRIKWNRHLDGSSSRRLEDEAGTQEADEKKRGANSSSGSIFKIFRRKKKNRRDENDDKIKESNGNVPPLQSEADEDDAASVSSVATCASQPVTEGFQRERASSLFSSFRLSLPGSKRKKRKVAPTPSETLLSGQDSEPPQLERYSTPDLRKTSDKLVPSNDVKNNLCTSSPSIRTKTSSNSAQSLVVGKNSESFDKLKWSNLKSVSSSGTKLSKSVSFSDCGDSLIGSQHSKIDNKHLRGVNSKTMVEEDLEAFESKLAACMSDNSWINRENKPSVESPSSLLTTPSLQEDPCDEAVFTSVVTKNESVNIENSNVNNANNFDNITSNVPEMLPSSEAINIDKVYVENASSTENLVSVINRDSNGFVGGENSTENDDIQENQKEITVSQSVESKIGVLNRNFENCDNDGINRLVHSSVQDINNQQLNSSNSVSLNKKLEVLSAELCELTAVQDLPSLKPCNGDLNDSENVNVSISDIKSKSSYHEQFNQKIAKFESPVFDRNSFENSKHVFCHMRVYENESMKQKFENSLKVDNNASVFEKVISQTPEAKAIFENNCLYETENIDISASKTESNCELNSSYSSSYNQDANKSSALKLWSENNANCDQKVPECEMHVYHNIQNDQKVPEFERSLLEFEEVCSNYMSQCHLDLSEYDSTTPLFNNYTKPKSVLDMNLTFVYPSFQKSDISGIYLYDKEIDNLSPSPNELNKNIKINNSCSHLQNSCQYSPEKSFLPSLPKQWINYEKTTHNDSNHNIDIEKVQCTEVHGKNLCQQPCLEDLPITVMLDDSNLQGIDMPGVSSTLSADEIKSGRDNSSVTSDKHLFDDHTSQEDMVSKVGVKISSLNCVLNYSFAPETSGNISAYRDPEIRDTYHGPRAICDPLVYSTEVGKGFESLAPENYLNGHNFCDRRNVELGGVISDISHDYIPAGTGLIEISNPYEEDTFLLRDVSNHNFLKDADFLLSNSCANTVVKDNVDSCNNFEISTSCVDENFSSKASEVTEIVSNIDKDNSEKQVSNNNEMTNMAEEKTKQSLISEKELDKSKKMNHIEQKNAINKSKNSMIPCRTKRYNDNETKKSEKKTKSKKSNSLPRFNTSESNLPLKSNKSHRVFSNSCKDSVVENVHRKENDLSVNKTDGIIAINSACDNSRISELNSHQGSTTHRAHSNYCVANENDKTQNVCPNSESNVCSSTPTLKENQDSFVENLDICKNVFCRSENALSSKSADDIFSIPEIKVEDMTVSSTSSINSGENKSKIISPSANNYDENSDLNIKSELCPLCFNLDQDHIDGFSENMQYHYCSKHSDTAESWRRFSLPVIGMHKSNCTSSRESLNSQLTSSSKRGKSRIPRKQTGTRGAPSKGPVRPPMWLSKAELTQEIQRLGTLCEARTKELNRLKMETKHVSSGFDAFAALFKYMVEDLNGLSVPALTKDLEKTLKQLELTKQDLAFYEREVEEMKSHHCQELNDLSNKLFEVYQSEVAELNAKHQEEINHLKSEHQKQMEHLTAKYEASSEEAKAHHEKMIASLEQEIVNQREELHQYQERELKDLEEKHTESTKLLQDHIEQLQKKCAELKQHSMSMEDAMRKDTDSKLQWVTSVKLDLEKEVESLKAVLEMKNKELHTIRVQNLEMEKQLEELPFAREKIKMLQARAEDLEALMLEKTKLERKLCTENQQIKDNYEKETKVNRRLSMENEELQWRLRQAENSLISGSFNEVPEYPEAEETAATSPTKSPGPQMLSRSVFFTFVDKDESSPHSPRSQYKKITPNFAANYKTSPAKSSKSPPVPSPRRGKSHSEPPQPVTMSSTPRKVAKQTLNKTKVSQKRQRSGSDSSRLSEQIEVNFSSVAESMASSVSSESSVFEQQERLLEEHKEQIFHSLEILREQRSTESSVDEPTIGKKWCSDDIKITGDLPNLEIEDMSRSAEFSDPKTYYHMTFPVLKESGVIDCDIDDSSGKNSSSGNSPVKEIPNSIKHSTLENNTNAIEASGTTQNMSISSQEVKSRAASDGNKRKSCTESTLPAENVQRKASNCDKTENRWRTI